MRKEICLIEKLDKRIPVEEIYKIFEGHPYSVILDSSLKDNKLGKYSIIAFDPFKVFKSWGETVEIRTGGVTEVFNCDPFEVLGNLLNMYKYENSNNNIPFSCGCIGYFSYELYRLLESIPDFKKNDDKTPDIILGFYNNAVIIDHTYENIYITAASFGLTEYCDLEITVRKKLMEIKNIILEGRHFNDLDPINRNSNNLLKRNSAPKSNFTKEAYCEMVKTVKEYIRNGDIYQANISQKFEIQSNENPFAVFERLRKLCPAPFSAFLNFDEIKIVSSSPERFIKISGRSIETRPIKGTRPRGKNQFEDDLLKKELLNSEKDKAELTMIVDLERNDIGRVCKLGSVAVEKLFEIEEYANVFHLVSTIKGELRDDIDAVDCIKAAFPGGSITGAPKIRAMEIIEELEPTKRHVYTGSIGYIGFDGNTDLNIAIRTIIINDNKACYNVGGGITWDSDPEMEYQETLDKGKFMMEVLLEL